MATNKGKKTAAEDYNALRITALPEKFRRAGLAFTRQPTVILIDDLTQEQEDALRAETMLVVEQVTVDAPAAQ
jgi:Mu-like prophage FluMu N-terminal domain